MNGLSIRNAIGPVLFLVAAGFVVARFFLGCTPAQVQTAALNVEQAAGVKRYDDILVSCMQSARQKPKALQFEAYVDCEQATSKFFCESSPALRKEWPRCSELGLGE